MICLQRQTYQWRKKYGSNSNDDVTLDNNESMDELRKNREENLKIKKDSIF